MSLLLGTLLIQILVREESWQFNFSPQRAIPHLFGRSLKQQPSTIYAWSELAAALLTSRRLAHYLSALFIKS
jgi:hypothetical protein